MHLAVGTSLQPVVPEIEEVSLGIKDDRSQGPVELGGGEKFPGDQRTTDELVEYEPISITVRVRVIPYAERGMDIGHDKHQVLDIGSIEMGE